MKDSKWWDTYYPQTLAIHTCPPQDEGFKMMDTYYP